MEFRISITESLLEIRGHGRFESERVKGDRRFEGEEGDLVDDVNVNYLIQINDSDIGFWR